MKLVQVRWVATVAILLVLMLFGGASIVSAHAKLKSSVPAAGSTVNAAPKTVVAVFDNHDELKAEGSLLRITDTGGKSVDMGDSALDRSDAERKTLKISLQTGLADGTYTVTWMAVSSADNSSAQGSFMFTVATGAPTPPTLPATGSEESPAVVVLLGVVMMLLIGGMSIRRKAIR